MLLFGVSDCVPTKMIPRLSTSCTTTSVSNSPPDVTLSNVHRGRSVVQDVDSFPSLLATRNCLEGVVIPGPHLATCGNQCHGSSPPGTAELLKHGAAVHVYFTISPPFGIFLPRHSYYWN